MDRRVAQPPVDPRRRDPERPDFWLGFILVVIALLLLFSGARHVTSVETTEGAAAHEFQLVKSFTSGGLKVAGAAVAPDPATFDDPAAAAAALDRWAREQAKPLPLKYRVNTGAAAPCPT